MSAISQRASHRTLTVLVGWVVALALAGLWQVVAQAAGLFSLSTFSDSVAALWDVVSGPAFRADVVPTVGRAALGFAISAVLGAAAGIVIGLFRGIDPWIRPVIEFGRALPPPLLLPLVMLVFGLTATTEIVTIVLAAFWPVLLNAIDGARQVDPLYLDTARACRAGRITMLTRVILPASLPQIFVGLRIALSMSLIMVVLAEMLATGSGLGYQIRISQETFEVPRTYGLAVLLGIIGWLFDTIFLTVERRFVSWHSELGARTRA
jgi:ABC-type nitrate/sulfonate/bicarbonate transport system permease component